MMESGKAKQMADLNMVPIELQEALWIAVSEKDRESNRRIAIWLSAQQCRIDSFQTVTGECVDFRTSPQGLEAENPDEWNSRYGASWEQAAAILRALFNQRGCT